MGAETASGACESARIVRAGGCDLLDDETAASARFGNLKAKYPKARPYVRDHALDLVAGEPEALSLAGISVVRFPASRDARRGDLRGGDRANEGHDPLKVEAF